MKTKFTLFAICVLFTPAINAQWGTDTRLTSDVATSLTSVNHSWSIAASGDTLHVVWIESRDGNDEVYYKRSTNGGTTWGADTRLTTNTAISEYAAVTVSGSVVNVIWDDGRDGNFEIYTKRSADAGTTWGADTRVTYNTANSYGPCIASYGPKVSAVWRDDRDGNIEIYYSYSVDGGLTWSSDTALTVDPAISWLPSVSVVDSVVNVIWWDNRPGNDEIYATRSGDDGLNWSPETRLTFDVAASSYASVAASGLYVYVVWKDYRDGNNEIYMKRSIDGGISWGADTRLTSDPGNSELPSITASGPIVHVIWDDDRDGNSEVYYKRSVDNGVTWSTDTRLTSDGAISYRASVAASGAKLHVAWTDTRDANYEIYYKNDVTGNLSGIDEWSMNDQLSVHPNPFTTATTINSETGLHYATLTVTNSLGQIMIRQDNISGQTFDLERGDLTAGIYFVQIIQDDKVVAREKIMISNN